MKLFRFAAIAALFACLAAYVAYGQATGPTIELLANGSPLGATVSPDSSGLVRFGARITDATGLFNRDSLAAGTSQVATFFTPTQGPVVLTLYYSARYKASGTQITVTATATDTTGNVSTQAATVTLIK